MMKKNIPHHYYFAVIIILISGILINSCGKKEPELIIAKAGNTKIPLSEFIDRYEFTPHILQTSSKKINKRNALSSLLGEKVLVEEAKQQALHKSEKYKTYINQMEKEAIIEALFEQEVASKVAIDEKEIKKGYFRSQAELDLQVLTFDDLNQAEKAAMQIEAGKSLNQIKREFQTDTFISADSVLTLPMKWGEAHPILEDVAYNLKMNEVSRPIAVAGKYFILKLANKRSNILFTELDYINKSPSIKKVIVKRKRAELMTHYMVDLLKEKKVRVAHQVFNFVVGELEKVYSIDDSLTRPHKKKKLQDSPNAPFQNKELAGHLDDTFARFADGSTWTVGEFIKNLSVGPYILDYKSKRGFRNSLRRAIKRMTEFETMAERGRELNLHKTYYVQYQTKMWADSYIAQQLWHNIIDTVSVSDSEIEFFYEKNKKNYSGPEMVNLQEILVDDEKLAHKIYQNLQKGADFTRLARKYNKREVSIKKDGNMGYFSTSALGNIGKVAMNIKIGELAGPVKTEKGQYSVFVLKDKREAGPLPLKQVWKSAKNDALVDKRMRIMDEKLVSFADKYDIEVNQAIFDTVKTNDINMLVLKQHFANRTAAPIVTPLNKSHRWQNLIEKIVPLKK